MSQQIDLIDVHALNVEEAGFFCYMSKPKSEGYQRKLQWLKARFAEGMRIKMLRLPERGFIEYIPGEYAWSMGNWLEKRAAAAGLSEPGLLIDERHNLRVLDILDAITASIAQTEDRKDEEYRVLRQALGYCWSIVVAAAPEAGKTLMEKWMHRSDPDIRWIMKENLKKKRLIRLDAGWVQTWQERLKA